MSPCPPEGVDSESYFIQCAQQDWEKNFAEWRHFGQTKAYPAPASPKLMPPPPRCSNCATKTIVSPHLGDRQVEIYPGLSFPTSVI